MKIIDWLVGRKTQPDEGGYISKCFAERYSEEEEVRLWNSDPAFHKILDPLNAGDNLKARKEAEALVRDFHDFADIYVWWAKSLLNERNYQEAKRVLHMGLSNSKQKYPLLNLMGEVEWRLGSLSEAIYWWIQGLMGQEKVQGFGGEVGAYLYLYHIAEILDLSRLAAQLRERVDFISPGKIRLSPVATNSLATLVRASDTEQIRKALQMVEKKYFATQAQADSYKQDDEIPVLIRLAQDSSAGYDARKKAIQRLAEVGDSRAIGPLMQIYNTELTLIRLDAKDAVDKIRAQGK